MRKECEHTGKSLRKYLQGHLFKPERIRIERHLKQCALCSSELQALKRAAEAKKLLKDITPPDGVVQRVKERVSGLARLKKLLYRPLWIAGIVAAAAGVYGYVVIPIQRHFERERSEVAALSAPASEPALPAEASAPASAAEQKKPGTAAAPAPEPKKPQPEATAPSAAADPLTVTITVDDEKAAISRINAVMEGHALLRTMRFSDTAKEMSGSLTPKELLTFFSRIESVGRIRYSRSRLESSPAAEPLPFVMKLNVAPKPPEQASQPAAPSLPKAENKPLSGSSAAP